MIEKEEQELKKAKESVIRLFLVLLVVGIVVFFLSAFFSDGWVSKSFQMFGSLLVGSSFGILKWGPLIMKLERELERKPEST